jgi:hypothetical protein
LSSTNAIRSTFGNRPLDASNMIKLYVPENSNTFNSCLRTDIRSLVGANITWTNDMTTNGCHYNTGYNIYIYPVANVQAKYEENELNKEVEILSYSTTWADGYPNLEVYPDGFGKKRNVVQNTVNTSLYDVTITSKTVPEFIQMRNSYIGNIYRVRTADAASLQNAFAFASNLKSSPVCGPNVTNMYRTYYECRNLTGQPACGNKVTNMAATYYNCRSLTGNPVCGNNVTSMYQTYAACASLTGPPVCGPNVTNMSVAYSGCANLTGSPVCGPNVKTMSYAYSECNNLTGNPVCGPNVTNMSFAYYYSANVHGNMYMLSDNVNDVSNCFYGRNISNTLNVYVNANSTTFTTITKEYSYFAGTSSAAVDATATDGYYYIPGSGILIYPVANVAAMKEQNGD